MKKTGSSLILLAALFVPSIAASKKRTAEPYAVVAGTVFRETGFALPGAQVTVAPNPENGQAPAKIKKMQALSDSRGEFAFRVPPVPMRYTVRVAAKGFESVEKSVSVQGEERTDATFQLRPESK